MLKFRNTNSMKARRAAEHQRKALEEQLKMEWAWKPMAAVMNENKTDLVYWVPPLYASNILNSFTASSSNASSPVSSLCSSPSLSRSRSLSRRSTFTDGTPMGSRKKRLSKRRVNLSPRQSIEELGEELEMDGPSGLQESSPNSGDSLQRPSSSNSKAGKFAGTMKKDLVVEFEAEEIDIIETIPETSVDDEIAFHNKETLRMREKQHGKHNTEKEKPENKRKSIPSILRILEKVSHLHHHQKNRPMTRRNAKIERTMSSGSQKIKRPSLKVYQNNPKHGSGRRATAPAIPTQPPLTEAREARMVITGKNNSGPRLSIRRASRQSTAARSRSASVTTTGLKVSQVTEAELRSAHLEMMIKILATLYEEKISRQDSEIKTLKEKFKSQDKIVKQIVHNMLEVKSEVKSYRDHLIQQEEAFHHHRSQQLIAQQSIPEEIEEVADLEMYEMELQNNEEDEEDEDVEGEVEEPVSINSTTVDKDSYNPITLAKSEDYSDGFGAGLDDTVDACSVTTIQPADIVEEAYIPQVLNVTQNDILNVDECQVLDPPDEFQCEQTGAHNNITKSHLTLGRTDNPPLIDQQSLISSIKDELEAQDNNEFNIQYHKLATDEIVEHIDHIEHIAEHFLATQYVCDYHPREEQRMKQLREKIYFEETLSNIEEDDRCSVISRQRSDDSTNI